MNRTNPAPRRHPGFTVVELAVLFVCVGMLAAFGVPRFIKSVERARAAEAFTYLDSVRASQERYQAQYATYAANLCDLDITSTPPKGFSVPAVFEASSGGTSLRDSWSLTMTRTGSSAGHGAYTVVFTETGFDAGRSTINRDPANIDIDPAGH